MGPVESTDSTSGTTATVADDDDDFLIDYATHVILILLTLLVFVVGIAGNSVVILAVMLSNRLRSSTNWFVVNLAVADFLTCLCLPFHRPIVSLFSSQGWPLPRWYCTVTEGITSMCIGASIATLALIGFNRWYLLTRPPAAFHKLFRRRNIIFMVALVWFYLFLLTFIPAGIGYCSFGYNPKEKTCTSIDTQPSASNCRLIQGIGLTPIPTIVIVVTYTRIYLFVRQHDREMKSMGRSTTSQSPRKDNVRKVGQKSDSTGVTGDTNLSTTLTCEPDNHTGINTLRCKSPEVALEDAPDNDVQSRGSNPVVQDSEGSIKTVNLQSSPQLNSGNLAITPSPSIEINAQPILSCEAAIGRVDVITLQTDKEQILLKKLTKGPSAIKHHITVTKRMALIMSVFFVCLLPTTFCHLIPGKSVVKLLPWAGVLTIINSCVNPFIYARTMPVFRSVMGCIVKCQFDKIPEPIPFIRRMRRNQRNI